MNYQLLSDVKKSNSWTMEEVPKKELDIMRSILGSHLMIIKTSQNVHKMFRVVLMTFTCEVKIGLIKS